MKKYILLIIIAAMGLQGCRDWLDINYTPNNASASSVSAELLLTSAEYDMVADNANDYSTLMIAQHITKSGEVSGTYTFLSGLVMPQNVDDWWELYYRLNANFKLIEEKAIERGNPALLGIAQLLTNCNYQRLVDMYGNIPYSQAGQPKEYPTPEYDKAEDIYADLLTKIDVTIGHLEAAAASTNLDLSALRKADIICKGDLKLWVRLAYTQKLRLLMRISDVRDVKAQLTSIADKCLTINENVSMNPGFYVETNKMNIFYQTFGFNNLGNVLSANKYYMPTSSVVDMLRDNNDPRLRVYIDPRPTLGDHAYANYSKYGLGQERYVGIPYGQINPASASYTCRIGLGILAGGSDKNAGAKAPTNYICGAEIGFFLAEAALRGLIPGGDVKAKEYYEAAVTSAMKRHEKAMQDNGYTAKGVRPPIEGSAEQAAKAFLSQDNDFVNWDKMTSTERKLEAIHSQKWLSLFGYNPLEAWFEQRRSDFPKLKASVSGQENKLLCKLPYPQSERNLNPANVAAQGDVDVYNSLVFWDLKNEIVPRTEPYL